MKNFTSRTPRSSALKVFLLAVFCLTASTNASATAAIDATFGTNGRVTISLGESQYVSGFALQNDDKIVAIGNIQGNAGRDGVVVRYNANGTLDANFGNDGKVVLPITSGDDLFYGTAVQTDGKIVVVGSVSPVAGSTVTDFLILRLNPNGSLDGGFGNGGIVTVNQSGQDSLRAVKIQPDGKIVAVGGTSDEGGRGAIIRLNPNGSFDTSFSGGIVFINRSYPTNELFTSVDVYLNGRVLAGGQFNNGNDPSSRGGMVTLLETNGAIVQKFGNSGFLQTDLPFYTLRTFVKILPNGNFVAGSWNPSRYTNDGVYISEIARREVEDIGFLSNGNFVVLSQTSPYLNVNGILVLNKNFRRVGNDEKDLGISEFSGTAVKVQSNDKILILKDNTLLRLHGVTSNGTRIANFEDEFYDRKTDFAVYRPSNRTFYSLLSFGLVRTYQAVGNPTQSIPERSISYWQAEPQNGAPGYFRYAGGSTSFQWGASGDIPVGGDYDGDNFTDYAVFRPSNGVWYVAQSSDNQFRAFAFGQAGDKLVPADYDNDGITDFAVFRPSNGAWYVSRSSDGGFVGVQFGQNGDVPITGDFDGDGRADFTVFRPSNGVWYSLKSREGFSAVAFGTATDIPVPGDYDGDGRHDQAVFRAGIWYILGSRDGFRAVQWGLPDDVPLSVRY